MIERLLKYIKILYDNIKFYSVKLYWKFEKDHIWVLSSGIAENIRYENKNAELLSKPVISFLTL